MKKKQTNHPPKKTCETEPPDPGSSPVCYAESVEVQPAYRWEVPEKEPPPSKAKKNK